MGTLAQLNTGPQKRWNHRRTDGGGSCPAGWEAGCFASHAAGLRPICHLLSLPVLPLTTSYFCSVSSPSFSQPVPPAHAAFPDLADGVCGYPCPVS